MMAMTTMLLTRNVRDSIGALSSRGMPRPMLALRGGFAEDGLPNRSLLWELRPTVVRESAISFGFRRSRLRQRGAVDKFLSPAETGHEIDRPDSLAKSRGVPDPFSPPP
jgi:hypothetical protein